MRPFIVPLLWAAILAFVTWPLYQRLADRTRHRELAAGVFALLVALAFGVPVAMVLANLASELTDIAREAIAWQQAGAPLPAWISEHWLGQRALQLLRDSTSSTPSGSARSSPAPAARSRAAWWPWPGASRATRSSSAS
jgi:predicted PurR-regulated permease PerM